MQSAWLLGIAAPISLSPEAYNKNYSIFVSNQPSSIRHDAQGNYYVRA
jgi:hypothetical protein